MSAPDIASPARPGALLQRYGMPPGAIEAESLRRIDRSLTHRQPADSLEETLVRRIVYAAGDLALADSVRWSPNAIQVGIDALRAGALIVCDVQMVLAGLNAPTRQTLGCGTLCASCSPGARALAEEAQITRTAAGMLLSVERLDAAVVVIGNAPTALLALLDLVDSGRVLPALIVGMPVGFVAAMESKQLLQERTIPYITLTGTRGGSPLAVAATNFLLSRAVNGGTGG